MIQALRHSLVCALAAVPAIADDSNGVREYLDSVSAVTVTVASEPLVFARERGDLAVNARDYLSLAPLEANRSGEHSCFWSGYFWSTIDRRDGALLLAPGDELVLVADGRPIPLRAEPRSMRELGIVDPPTKPPARDGAALLFTTDQEIVDYVAAADELHIEVVHDGSTESFALWRGSSRTLSGFTQRSNCGTPTLPRRPAR